MVPYLDISETNALSAAFDYNGLHWAANAVSAGAILSLSCIVISNIMCISRLTYAIASEGLLFRFLARVNARTQVPIIATVCGAMIVIPTAFFVPLEDLADMMEFGNLVAYAFIAFAVIKLRTTILEFPKHDWSTDLCDEASSLLGNGNENNSPKTIFHEISKSDKNQPGFCLAFFWSNSCITDYGDDNGYRVPFVPVLPAFSVFVNFYLMTQLSLVTWARSAIWVTCGLLIYFFYGAKNSSLEEKELDDSSIECE
ncbi:high affinity cationic amino acid transporter 1-like [Symsagittifera roscoffensis]|uniref:high affinity cationic amino acid transporter 1-like n=1 Tax=Symsagittifera roscoffensis TaxID=84072 RepID=UPI00307BC050